MEADSATIIPDTHSRAGPSAGATPWPQVWVGIVTLAAVTATGAMYVRGSSGGSAGSTGLFLPVLCLGVLLVAAGFDAATNRIPNALTLIAALAGLLLNTLSVLLVQVAPRMADQWFGAVGPLQSLYGLLLFGGIGMVGVLFAGMGGGDMKLLGAIGALLGMSRAADILICGAAVAVVYALIELIVAGRLSAVFRRAAGHLLNWFYLRRWSLADDPDPPGRRRTIPLAIPLLAGMMLAQTPWVARSISWLIRAD